MVLLPLQRRNLGQAGYEKEPEGDHSMAWDRVGRGKPSLRLALFSLGSGHWWVGWKMQRLRVDQQSDIFTQQDSRSRPARRNRWRERDLLSAGVPRTPEPVCRSKSQLCQAVGSQRQALGMGGWSPQAVKDSGE